jgi:hypothetical protein
VFVLAGVAGAAAVVIAAGTTLARPCDAPAT